MVLSHAYLPAPSWVVTQELIVIPALLMDGDALWWAKVAGVATAVNALASVVLASLTGVYAWLTHKLVKQNGDQAQLLQNQQAEATRAKMGEMLALIEKFRAVIVQLPNRPNPESGEVRNVGMWGDQDADRLEFLASAIDVSLVPIATRATASLRIIGSAVANVKAMPRGSSGTFGGTTWPNRIAETEGAFGELIGKCLTYR